MRCYKLDGNRRAAQSSNHETLDAFARSLLFPFPEIEVGESQEDYAARIESLVSDKIAELQADGWLVAPLPDSSLISPVLNEAGDAWVEGLSAEEIAARVVALRKSYCKKIDVYVNSVWRPQYVTDSPIQQAVYVAKMIEAFTVLQDTANNATAEKAPIISEQVKEEAMYANTAPAVAIVAEAMLINSLLAGQEGQPGWFYLAGRSEGIRLDAKADLENKTLESDMEAIFQQVVSRLAALQ